MNNNNTFIDRLKQNTISNLTSSTIQSVMNNDYDNFIDNLKHQSINTLITTVASYGANYIGEQYHNNNFSNNNVLNKLTQLTLHAGLGAISNELMGNDGVSGAVSGITGELFAELLSNSLYNTTDANLLTEQQKTILKEYGGFASGISSLIVGKIKDLDNNEIINNIYGGYRIGKNAIENNYLMPNEKGNLMEELNNCGNDNNCKKEVQEKYEEISKPRDEEFYEAYISCKEFESCDKLKELHYDLRMELTEEGNEYYKEHPEEFEKLPNALSIYHTFRKDPKTGEVLATGQNGNKKYIHKLYGYEVVLDKNGDIVTDSVNIGTYNFYNPNSIYNNELIGNYLSHKQFDMNPYDILGNASDDNNSSKNRSKLRWIGAFLGKQN